MENVFSPTKEGQEWGSHLPALIACIAASKGNVLEIGAGHYSTPCLHALCHVLSRPLVTVEAEDLWRKQFEHYSNISHVFYKQSEELLKDLATKQWGVVFVDDLVGSRVSRAEMFFDNAEFVLFHDCNFPMFVDGLNDFVQKKRCEHVVYNQYTPHTLIVSKYKQIPKFF